MAHATPSYEQARAELREIVGKLEGGGQSLEESLALWERGEQLADVCQQWLDGASTKLDEAIAEHDTVSPHPTQNSLPSGSASVTE